MKYLHITYICWILSRLWNTWKTTQCKWYVNNCLLYCVRINKNKTCSCSKPFFFPEYFNPGWWKAQMWNLEIHSIPWAEDSPRNRLQCQCYRCLELSQQPWLFTHLIKKISLRQVGKSLTWFSCFFLFLFLSPLGKWRILGSQNGAIIDRAGPRGIVVTTHRLLG